MRDLEPANKTFEDLFIEGEKKSFISSINLKWLRIFITLFFLSILICVVVYLSIREELSSPYVKWVTLEIPFSKADMLDDILQDVTSSNTMSGYGIDTITTHHQREYEFKKRLSGKSKYYKGSTISPSSPLLAELLDDDSRASFKEEAFGLIVSKKMLDSLEYKKDASHIGIVLFGDEVTQVPIIKVVDELPTSNRFLFNPFFVYQTIKNGGNVFNVRQETCLSMFVPDGIADDVKKAARKQHSSDSIRFVESDCLSRISGKNIRLMVNNGCPGSREDADTIYSRLVGADPVFKERVVRHFPYRFLNFTPDVFAEFSENVIPADLLSINFNDLGRIGDFKEYLFDKYDVQIADEKVRDKLLFDKLKYFIWFLIGVLMFSCFLGLYLYLKNKLGNHFSAIAKQIGNYKALGLKDSTLRKLYQQVLLKDILSGVLKFSVLWSFALSIVFIIASVSMAWLKDIYLDYALSVTAVLIGLSVVFVWIIVKTLKGRFNLLLAKTPGELIY